MPPQASVGASLLNEDFPLIDRLQSQQQQESLSRPPPLTPLRHLRNSLEEAESEGGKRRGNEEVDMGASGVTAAGAGSSPEDEAGKLLHRSRSGHLSVDALMLNKTEDGSSLPSIDQSYGLCESEC